MDNIIIRNIKDEDIPAVVDIKINGWQMAYIGIIDQKYLNGLPLERDSRIEKMRKTYSANGFVVAELNDQVVAFCRYIGNNSLSPEVKEADCELTALYVKPDLKGHGIGTSLFKHVVKEFQEQHKTTMILWCLKDNEPSKKFYAKMGGQIIHERPVLIGNTNYTEVCFKYDLLSHS